MKALGAALALLCIAAAACGGGATSVRAEPARCRADADCLPATCCHPTACVPRERAPDCRGVACTRHCAPGTMDCGGGCECRAGECVARIAPAPAARDVLPAR